MYTMKTKGPRTEPWEHHRRRYTRTDCRKLLKPSHNINFLRCRKNNEIFRLNGVMFCYHFVVLHVCSYDVDWIDLKIIGSELTRQDTFFYKCDLFTAAVETHVRAACGMPRDALSHCQSSPVSVPEGR